SLPLPVLSDATAFFAMSSIVCATCSAVCGLLNLLMNGYPPQDGVKFLKLQPLGGILFIFGGDVTRHPRKPALFMLGAFQNHLYPISFFSHCFTILSSTVPGGNISQIKRIPF